MYIKTDYARRIAADATNTIAITAAASSDRIDSIVAYIDNSVTPVTTVVDNTNNILKFVAVAGTPAATPVAPSSATIQTAIGAGNPYMVLWDVTIPANATALNAATFTDKRTIASNLDAISALNTAVSTLKASLTISQFNSNDTLGTFSNITISTKELTLAQSSDGSIFKFYGRIYASNSTSSNRYYTPTGAVPGLSGYYGRATGLYLNTAPDSAFMFNGGIRNRSGSSPTDAVANVAVGSDGQIYVFVTTSSNGITVDSNTTDNIFFWPCIYYNTNFGDGGNGE